jgi:hypothetical protein
MSSSNNVLNLAELPRHVAEALKGLDTDGDGHINLSELHVGAEEASKSVRKVRALPPRCRCPTARAVHMHAHVHARARARARVRRRRQASGRAACAAARARAPLLLRRRYSCAGASAAP